MRTWRIPNAITVTAAAAGLIFHGATAGFSGIRLSILGMGVGLGLLMIPYLLGGMGGGDVKLLGALGAWLGPKGILFATLYSGLAGGLLALGVFVFSGKGIIQSMKRIYEDVVYFISFRQRHPSGVRSRLRIPYSLAIAAGTLGFVILGAPI